MIRVVDRASKLLPGLAFMAAVLAVVEVLVSRGVIRRALLPPPSVIAGTLFDILAAGDVVRPLSSTLGLFLAGFSIAAVLGIGVGLWMGTSRFADNLLQPLVELVRPMPKAALVPVLILFLGLGPAMKITSIASATFFPILLNTIQGVRSVDPVLIGTGRTFGRSRLAILLRVVLPAALPFIMAGLRIAVGLALLMTVLSEMLAGTGGLGGVILENQRAFRIRQMYAWLVVLAAVGLAISVVMATAERRLAPWMDKHRI